MAEEPVGAASLRQAQPPASSAPPLASGFDEAVVVSEVVASEVVVPEVGPSEVGPSTRTRHGRQIGGEAAK